MKYVLAVQSAKNRNCSGCGRSEGTGVHTMELSGSRQSDEGLTQKKSSIFICMSCTQEALGLMKRPPAQRIMDAP